MLTPVWSGRFKRDVRRAQKRGKDMGKLKTVLSLLIEGQPLAAAYRDHALRGNWNGFRDLHIEPDWLLLYRIEGDELQLLHTGKDARSPRNGFTSCDGAGVSASRDRPGLK